MCRGRRAQTGRRRVTWAWKSKKLLDDIGGEYNAASAGHAGPPRRAGCGVIGANAAGTAGPTWRDRTFQTTFPMQIRPVEPRDLDLLSEIDGTVESSQYLHVERTGEGLGTAWRLHERPLRERLVRSNPIDDDRRFVIKQIVTGGDDGLALMAEHDDVPVALLAASPDLGRRDAPHSRAAGRLRLPPAGHRDRPDLPGDRRRPRRRAAGGRGRDHDRQPPRRPAPVQVRLRRRRPRRPAPLEPRPREGDRDAVLVRGAGLSGKGWSGGVVEGGNARSRCARCTPVDEGPRIPHQ